MISEYVVFRTLFLKFLQTVHQNTYYRHRYYHPWTGAASGKSSIDCQERSAIVSLLHKRKKKIRQIDTTSILPSPPRLIVVEKITDHVD